MIHGGEVAIVSIVFGSGALTVWTLSKVYLRKLELTHGSRASQLDDSVEQRLARIEQGVEAIAIEVERVSEGQRFTTKLLADRGPSR